MLGLDDEKLGHAIGLAYMQAAGGKEAGVGMGSQARSIYPAFASMGGVQAAFFRHFHQTFPQLPLFTSLYPIGIGSSRQSEAR